MRKKLMDPLFKYLNIILQNDKVPTDKDPRMISKKWCQIRTVTSLTWAVSVGFPSKFVKIINSRN